MNCKSEIFNTSLNATEFIFRKHLCVPICYGIMEFTTDKIIEILSAFSSVISIWLNTKRNILGWPIGLLSVLLAAWVYYKSSLFAECGLQVFFFISGIYGWWNWQTGKKEDGKLRVDRISISGLTTSLVCGILGYALIYSVLIRFSEASLPLADAGITAFSIVAQIWLARRWIENWLLWILINISSVLLYLNKELWFFSGLYGILLLLAIRGYMDWKKELHEK